MGIVIGTHTEWLIVLCFRIELEFGNCGERKDETPGKTLEARSKDKKQQNTRPTSFPGPFPWQDSGNEVEHSPTHGNCQARQR